VVHVNDFTEFSVRHRIADPVPVLAAGLPIPTESRRLGKTSAKTFNTHRLPARAPVPDAFPDLPRRSDIGANPRSRARRAARQIPTECQMMEGASRMRARTFVFFALIAFSGFQVMAGTTGKIAGRIASKETQEGIPGANVMVVGTSMGAASDINGYFTILNVPPGSYTVRASIIGYSPVSVEGVRVQLDLTARVDFKLEAQVIEGDEVVIMAKKDLIQIDVSATENFITAEQYASTPFANRIEDVLAMQSGVSGSIIEGEITMRAGATHEVGFMMDGMSLTDTKFNRPVISIQPEMVQEVKVMRSGFGAEYGQARSGMINVVTKNPSDAYRFTMNYQLTPKHRRHYGPSIYDRDNRWEWQLMDGPDKFVGDTLVVPEGREGIIKTWIGWNKYSEKLKKDTDPSNDLEPEEAYELWKWQHRPIPYGNRNDHNLDATFSGKVPLLPWRSNFILGGKYEYHPFIYPQARTHYDERIGSLKWINELRSNMKVTFNSMVSEVRSVAKKSVYSDQYFLNEDRISYDGDTGSESDLYYPFSQPLTDRTTSLVGIGLTHMLNPKLFYELNLDHFFVKWNVRQADSSRAEDGRVFGGRLYYDPQSGWIPKEKGYDDMVSGYRMYGDASTAMGSTNRVWDDSYNRRTAFKGSLTWQFHPSHELKSGFEYRYEILRENRTLWLNGDSSRYYKAAYKVKPIEFGLYLQDKVEFQGMIANAGLRLDCFNTNSEGPDPRAIFNYPSDKALLDDFMAGKYPTFRAKPKYYLSPRLGISHPLSAHSKIYFNYGHFVQQPLSTALYTTITDGDQQRVGYMCDSDIPFEKTIAYEVGYDLGVGDWFQLHAGAFYKDVYDEYSRVAKVHTDQSLVVEQASHQFYSEIRGIEIEIRKTSGRFITGWINYNYVNKATANLAALPLSWIPIVTSDPNVGRNGVIMGIPRSNIIDIVPNARGVVKFSAPAGWGPTLWRIPVLQNTSLILQLYYTAGAKHRHPDGAWRNQHPDVWFRYLDRYKADMRLSRVFQIGNISYEFYVDISNVLHSKFRYVPVVEEVRNDYYNDLYNQGKTNQVGTDQVSDRLILRTVYDDVYWARLKEVTMGLRLNL
jgi:hypothetical protein